jgi:hypothetical protein
VVELRELMNSGCLFDGEARGRGTKQVNWYYQQAVMFSEKHGPPPPTPNF